MQVEMWTLDRIKPYENNPRINDDAVADVVQSINEFGFGNRSSSTPPASSSSAIRGSKPPRF